MEEGRALFNRGTGLYGKGRYADAYSQLSGSIEVFANAGSNGEESLMNAHLWAGASAYYLSEFTTAENHYLLSLELAEKRNDLSFQANILTALANLKMYTTDYSDAGDLFLKAADRQREMGMTTEARGSFEYGGYAKVLAEEYEEALPVFDEALSRSPENRAETEKAWLYAMRGNCRYYLLDLSGAQEDYGIAVSLQESFGSSAELTQYLAWAGKVSMDRNEPEKALDFFRKALSMAEELANQEDRCRVLAYFGFLYAGTGEYDLAIAYYEDSLGAARSLGRQDLIIPAYESLAWIYGEAGRKDLLKKTNDKLIDLYRRNRDEEKLASLLNDQGLIFYSNGDYQKAIPLFQEAVSLYRKAENLTDLSVLLLNLGMSFENTGNMNKADQLFRESLALSIEEGNRGDAEELAGHLNYIYSENTDYAKIIESLKPLLTLYERENSLAELMHLNNNIGTYHYALGEYREAIESYSTARHISRRLDLPSDEAIHLHNIAQAKFALSEYDRALDFYLQALHLAEKQGVREIEANILNSLGELYRAWGWFEKSQEYYGKAEILFQELDDIEGLASVYNNIGQAIRLDGNPEEAIPFYEKALDLSRRNGDEQGEAINLSNLGEAFRESGRLDEARSSYERALRIDSKNRNLRGIVIRKNNLAVLTLAEGDEVAARKIFFECLEYWRNTGERREEASALRNIWASFFNLGDYANAAVYLSEAVKIFEELRLTARDEVRREYLELQVNSYRDLSVTYFFLEDWIMSLYFQELSRGKYLLEQLDVLNGEISFSADILQSFLNGLDKRSGLLTLSIVDENLLQTILVEKERITSTLVSIDVDFLDRFYSAYGNLIQRYIDDPEADRFESVLKLYRLLLARPVQTRSTDSAVKEIGTYLNSRLFGVYGEALAGIDHLIIVPDGLLGTIPFEALIDEEGTYLVEKYDITYAQSLIIEQLVHDRIYGEERKPLLAMGGAVYNSDSPPPADDEIDFSGIRLNVSEMIRSGEGTRGIYNSMGYGAWINLPGTLQEVNLLSDIVERSEVLSGAEVSEEKIKALSSTGELASYKALHFATHGIVVPEVPQLSAVVLSQFPPSGRGEDGYLTMSEISRLNIAADFVNLSACETGLGKIYRGEGVVGLTQAFLVAGANSLSVSLWQVSDESTMQFMTGVYSLVAEEKISYARAISRMKRAFIRDNRFASPFYWAPFIFYGNYEAGL